MSVAYLDTSWLVAMAFDEPGVEELGASLDPYDVLLATSLTEAEFAAVCSREGESVPARFMESLQWVFPTRRLTPEIERVRAEGYVRGADLLHVATALYAAESPRDIAFLTLDARQRDVAASVGFQTPV